MPGSAKRDAPGRSRRARPGMRLPAAWTLAARCSSWICPNCGRPVLTAFCPACGESRLDPKDLTLKGLLNQIFNALSAVDGRLLRSFRMLLWRPGALSLAYMDGRRMPFTPPFRLFLFANMLFFAMQSMTSSSIVSETLASHLHEQDWSALAQRLVARRLEAKGTSLDLYAPVFDQAVTLNAKSLIILMVLPFTLTLALTFRREPPAVRRPRRLRAALLRVPAAAVLRPARDRGAGGAARRQRHARPRQAAFPAYARRPAPPTCTAPLGSPTCRAAPSALARWRSSRWSSAP